MIYHGSSSRSLDDLGRTVEQTIFELKTRVEEFDSIVVTGMSGVVVGAPVALALEKPLVIVRKHDDGSHHVASDGSLVINKKRLGSRALFLDDFVSGGSTRFHVEREVERAGGRVTAQYMYADVVYKQRPALEPWEATVEYVPKRTSSDARISTSDIPF